MKHNFRKRIQQALAALRQHNGSSALVVSSNPHVTRSADQHFPYRANSDLYYLTGCVSPDVTLILRNKATPQVILLTPVDEPKKIVWEGAAPSLTPIAKAIGASVVRSKNIKKSLRELLYGVHCVFTQTTPNTTSNDIRQEFAKHTGETPRNTPYSFANADIIVSAQRLIKSRSEVHAIEEAGVVTGDVLHSILPLITPGTKEREIASLIECLYRTNGGVPSFHPIVASGPSAATLHYSAHNRNLRNGDLLLIDTGMELGFYCSDITRTIPVGTISKAQTTLYEAVLAAQIAAFKKIKHNSLIRDVYLAAAHEITIGLKETGVLKGSISSLMKKQAFKPYFPHGIGHSLGIDVHDVGGLYGNPEARLLSGMVFTIEPGVYLPKPTKHLPALGIRIEDDILVEKNGCAVLTEHTFPKNLEQVRELVGQATSESSLYS
ncbi:MAG: aminopeptidase P family protein [Pseudomonadota bacterium]|jgi:Xaa-Pro aminopeptidase